MCNWEPLPRMACVTMKLLSNFAVAVNASAAFRNSATDLMYEELVVLFGWDLETLW